MENVSSLKRSNFCKYERPPIQIVMKRPQLYIIFFTSTGNLPYLSCLLKVLFVLSLQPFSFLGGGVDLSPYDRKQAKSLLDSQKIRGPSLAQTL